MRTTMLLVCGTLSLAACSMGKEYPGPAVGTTTTTGATEQPQSTATVEAVRTVLLQSRPRATDDINALIITSEGGIITLRGKVMDEATHAALVSRVRAMQNVRGVRDELHAKPKGVEKHDRRDERPKK